MRTSRIGTWLIGLATLAAGLFWFWRRNRSAPEMRGAAPRGLAAPTPAPPPATHLHSPPASAPPSTTPPAPLRTLLVTPGRRWLMLALLAGALLFAVLGQSAFEEGRPYELLGPISPFIAKGVALYLIAIALFSTAALLSDRLSVGGEHRSTTPNESLPSAARDALGAFRSFWRDRRRLVSLLIVAALVALLLDLLAADPPLPDYTLPFVLWLSAIGLFIRAGVPRSHFRRASSTLPWWRSERSMAIGLMAVLLIAFVLRVWHVESIPATVGGDEGTFGLEAVKTITGEWPNRNPFTTGWLSHPTLSFYFNSITIRLFGQTVFGLRLAWALVGALGVLIVFQLVRRLAGTMLALTTAGLLAAYHFHIHYSRLGVNNIADPLLVALVLYLLVRALDRRNLLDWALCGTAIGVSQFFYFGARFTVIIAAGLIVYLIVLGGIRFMREHGRGIVILAGAVLVSAAPMIQYAVRYPLDYNARFNQIGIIGPSGWLENEVKVRNQSAAMILLDQLQRAALAFNVYPDRTGWYGSPRPLFDLPSGMLFLLGLGYATLRPFNRRLFPMVAWWWGAMILGGVLTESPPSSQRLVTIGAPAVFFVALALIKIGEIVQRAFNAWSPKRLLPYLSTAVVILGLLSVNYYFFEFTPLRVYGTFNGIVATDIAAYMRDTLGPDWRVYFLGAPRMYHDFGTIPYIVPEVEAVDILEPLVAPIDPATVPSDKNAAFIFLPERAGELEFVQATFPNGTLDEIPSLWEGDPNPFFVVYRVVLKTGTSLH